MMMVRFERGEVAVPARTVAVITPPYRDLRPNLGPVSPFSVFALDLRETSADHLPAVVEVFPTLRREHRAHPLVVVLPATFGALAPALQQVFGAGGISGVVVGTDDMEVQLRRALTTEHQLPRQVAEWFFLGQGRRVRGRDLIQYLLELGPARRLDLTAYRYVASRRTVTAALASLDLPSADRMRRLGLCLRAALRLQRAPGRPVHDIAVGLGLTSASSLGRMLKREFGVTPSTVRPTLGWEWLVIRWLERRGTDWRG